MHKGSSELVALLRADRLLRYLRRWAGDDFFFVPPLVGYAASVRILVASAVLWFRLMLARIVCALVVAPPCHFGQGLGCLSVMAC